MALNTVTLHWDLADLIQAGLTATLSITPTAQLSDTADHILIPPVARTYTFTGGTGQATGIVANDNASILPAGTGYLISVTAANGKVIVPQFQTQLLSSNGADQWLDALAVVPVVATSYQYVPLGGGVNMQGPLAPLDTNLIDASALTVSAGANDYTLHLTAAVGATRTVTLSPGLDGQVLTMLLIQPASGGPCAVTWAGIDWGRSLTAPALSSSANANDLLAWKWKTALSAWKFMGIN